MYLPQKFRQAKNGFPSDDYGNGAKSDAGTLAKIPSFICFNLVTPFAPGFWLKLQK